MGYTAKEIIVNTCAVAIGVIAAIIIMVIVTIILLVLFGLIPFGSSSSSHLYVFLVVIFSLITGSITGGYITGILSREKNIQYSLITGITLVVVYFFWNDFKINNPLFRTLSLVLIIPSTLLGYYWQRMRST